MNTVFRSEWSLRFWIQTVWKSWCGSSGSDINSDEFIAKQQAADISIGNRTPCICLTHLNNIKNLEVHKSRSVMWEKQTSSEGNCWIHLLRLFRKKRVDRNNLSSLITSYQSGTKCGVGSHRTCSHFFCLIAHILTIFDKKYRIWTCCDKRESYLIVLQQNNV